MITKEQVEEYAAHADKNRSLRGDLEERVLEVGARYYIADMKRQKKYTPSCEQCKHAQYEWEFWYGSFSFEWKAYWRGECEGSGSANVPYLYLYDEDALVEFERDAQEIWQEHLHAEQDAAMKRALKRLEKEKADLEAKLAESARNVDGTARRF